VNTDFLKDLGQKTKETLEPIAKFNELLSKSVQEAFNAQMSSTKKYSDFASSQFKAMSEIRDADSLQNFLKGQMDAFTSLNTQLMEDMKSLIETGEKFREEVGELLIKSKEVQSEQEVPAKAAETKK
jgi:phasin family protein